MIRYGNADYSLLIFVLSSICREAFSRGVYFTNFAAGYQIQREKQENILLSKFAVGEEIK